MEWVSRSKRKLVCEVLWDVVWALVAIVSGSESKVVGVSGSILMNETVQTLLVNYYIKVYWHHSFNPKSNIQSLKPQPFNF